MVGQHHGLDGQEFAQTLGPSEGQGSLVCCSAWGRKELDMTEKQGPQQMHLKKLFTLEHPSPHAGFLLVSPPSREHCPTVRQLQRG